MGRPRLPKEQHKAYQRTLEEALAGVPPRKKFENFSKERIIADPNDMRKRYAPDNHKYRQNFKDAEAKERKRLSSWMAGLSDPTHPLHSPENIKKFFEGQRKAAITRKLRSGGAFIPAGWRRDAWLAFLAERRQRAEIIVDRMEKAGVMTYDGSNKADKEAARKAMTTLVAVLDAGPEVAIQHRIKASEVVLSYTKMKPVARNAVSVKTAEDFLAPFIEDLEDKTMPKDLVDDEEAD